MTKTAKTSSRRPARSRRHETGDFDLTLLPGYDPFRAAGNCWFDISEATRVCKFYETKIRHSIGAFAGQLFKLSDWQRCFVANLFGWRRRGDNTRRYRKALLMAGRGNGKTPIAAGIGLIGLTADGELGSQVYSVASDKPQAGLMFDFLQGAINQDDELSRKCEIFHGIMHRSITLRSDQLSVYKVLSSDAKTKHGLVPHILIAEELHAWPTREMWDVFNTAMAKATRRQPLIVAITTSDFEREGSVCNELQDYAEGVISGKINDPAFLPAIWKADVKDDWEDERTWEKANPNIDITVSREALRETCEVAKHSPSTLNEVLRLHLNIRTRTANRFIDLSAWDKCSGSINRDGPCYVGLDLSGSKDLTAGAFVWPQADGTYHAEFEAWVPESDLRKREHSDHSTPYSTWVRQGWLHVTPGNAVDYEYIRQRMRERSAINQIEGIAIDPWNAQQLSVQLREHDGLNVVKFPQSFSHMNAPTKLLDTLIVQARLVHDRSPVARWAAGNCATTTDPAGNIRPCKKKSFERIDPIVALVMAIGMASTAPQAQEAPEIVLI